MQESDNKSGRCGEEIDSDLAERYNQDSKSLKGKKQT